MKPTKTILALSLLALAPAAWAAEAPRTLAEQTRTLQAQPGFIDLWRDEEKGRVLLSLSVLDQPFLMLSSLPYALGSNDVGLDRGQPGEMKLVRFQKHGTRIFLVQGNTRYVARSTDADERNAVAESFAAAVLWSGEILASENGRYLIDFSSFLLADQHGVAQRLADSKQGAYKVDEKRSAVLPALAKAFPDNVELEALLTFSGAGQGEHVRQVAADPASLSLRQHISMVRLPDQGYKPRAYHPASGGFDTGYYDFATPLASSLDVRWQLRHRLEKTVPGAAPSAVKKPIVYYLDRGAPEPVRSALLEGARWWSSAFEKAGFKDAFRVELLPEGADAMDVRYNVISWVHRATRGWSYGNALADPRTGEIIRGAVTLGSQRVRQDILIAESLLAPYGKAGNPELQKMAEQMALARLRQLAAHEVGHTLGFSHNFAASRQGNGSVMDYPHPVLKLEADGRIGLQEAYGAGVGPWDDYIVQHIYGELTDDELAQLRARANASGMQYVSDSDARTPGASHPNGLLWDFGPDSLKTWDQLGAIRRQALQRFSLDVLPNERQTGEIEARLVPVYLLQRYQTEALARLIGGGEFDYSTSGDVKAGRAQSGVRTVPAASQRQALARLADTLSAEYLALPPKVLDLLTPPATGYERNKEYFETRMNSVFDALSAVEAGAAHTASFLLDAGRINRLYWQHARDPGQPGIADLMVQVLQRTWKRPAASSTQAGSEAMQLSANWVVLDALLRLLNGGQMHAAAEAELRQQTADLGAWLKKTPSPDASTAASRQQAASHIQRYLADPRSVKLRPAPTIPPGAPI
ncbi:zinc-dependent metalloprotease [Massilia sp. BJB1822]|uniref:zinc-dependent metalloprotease n=1 Tax=Massilia sp. BJB1822 TaxID=2744470 RepID=UPI00159465EC|nr:zinc-dependent metalloprotease [Massilia sp. BJB1822]NVE01329.1 zinc-dependent metalloprotease [Massilia sp. BJB1822]